MRSAHEDVSHIYGRKVDDYGDSDTYNVRRLAWRRVGVCQMLVAGLTLNCPGREPRSLLASSIEQLTLLLICYAGNRSSCCSRETLHLRGFAGMRRYIARWSKISFAELAYLKTSRSGYYGPAGA